ncbi:hypothetical protein [Brevibacillus halotolerans]|uniref:hypothetical protein n=1 Tax=Brevibacillus halotolerans TaxID=1507437 RepID=UPI0015EEF89E|nr:hypothetical protein [Brevibacillus halotolerans]MBA4534934.1 hypothetical protein [Brevibacillus halotolerans]
MFKIGIAFLFGAFTHLFLAMAYAEYLSLEMMKVTGTKTDYRIDSFYSLFYWELAISAVIILLSFFIKKEPK